MYIRTHKFSRLSALTIGPDEWWHVKCNLKGPWPICHYLLIIPPENGNFAWLIKTKLQQPGNLTYPGKSIDPHCHGYDEYARLIYRPIQCLRTVCSANEAYRSIDERQQHRVHLENQYLRPFWLGQRPMPAKLSRGRHRTISGGKIVSRWDGAQEEGGIIDWAAVE